MSGFRLKLASGIRPEKWICYPTVARATGVSWMLGVGRLGSILGSSIGGVLLSQGWGFDGIFMALAAPAVLAALAILLNRRSL